MTLKLATFHTLTGHEFIISTNPSPTSIIPVGFKTLKAVAIERDNKDQLRWCKEFREVTKAIMKQVTKYFYSKSTPCLRRNYT